MTKLYTRAVRTRKALDIADVGHLPPSVGASALIRVTCQAPDGTRIVAYAPLAASFLGQCNAEVLHAYAHRPADFVEVVEVTTYAAAISNWRGWRNTPLIRNHALNTPRDRYQSAFGRLGAIIDAGKLRAFAGSDLEVFFSVLYQATGDAEVAYVLTAIYESRTVVPKIATTQAGRVRPLHAAAYSVAESAYAALLSSDPIRADWLYSEAARLLRQAEVSDDCSDVS